MNCSISMEFSPNESLSNSLIENAKKQETQIFDFRLILLDRITYFFKKESVHSFEIAHTTCLILIWSAVSP